MGIGDSVSTKDILKGGKTIKLIYQTIFSEPLSISYYGFFLEDTFYSKQ